MALPADVRLSDVSSPESKPRVPPRPITAPSLGRGRGHPARLADDGTRWCAYCEWTLDPARKTQRCTYCRDFRDRLRHRPILQAYDTLPIELVDGLIAATQTTADAMLTIDGRLALHQEPYGHELHTLSHAFANLHGIAAIIKDYAGRN